MRRNCLAFFLGVFAALVLGELVCRLAEDRRISQVLIFPRGNANYELTRPVPGDLVYEFVPGRCLNGLCTNSLGLRDLERRIVKPGGLKRILCVGDSITMGGSMAGNVPLLQTWPLVLERLLDNPDGQRIESWNAGFSGYNLVQYAAFLKRRAKKIKPDAIILGLCLNDLSVHQVIHKYRDRFEIEFQHREQAVVFDLGHGANQWLLGHSAMWRVVNRGGASMMEPKYGLLDPDGSRAEAAMKKIKHLAEDMNIPLLALIFPRLDDEGYSTPETNRDHRRLSLLVKREHVQAVELYHLFTRYPVGSLRMDPRDKGHPNALGHCLAAIGAYRRLLDMKIPWISSKEHRAGECVDILAPDNRFSSSFF
ncbi:MAG: SGNH/GDSL hydrolase family protein [Deltaproteobacteria bacterium]|nr:SGNH/GDSL hydrolase family protein [Deltaproteobacteria bacterium]